MRPGAGKQKGGAFERLVCKQLSLWMSRGLRDDLFWRSAMSGGRATLQHRKGKRNQTQLGDISAIHPQGARLTDLFVIECKSVKDLGLHGLFFAPPFGALIDYWAEVVRVAEACKKQPMLIARQNFFPPNSAIVCLNHSGMHAINESFSLMKVDVFVSFGDCYMHILQLDDLLKRGRRP